MLHESAASHARLVVHTPTCLQACCTHLPASHACMSDTPVSLVGHTGVVRMSHPYLHPCMSLFKINYFYNI